MKGRIALLCLVAGLPVVCGNAAADVLFSNGPVVTHSEGGTGTIAGLPISVADPYPTALGGQASTLGFNLTHSINNAGAENFVVPAGIPGWDLDGATFYAFQTSQTTPTVHTIRVNLWTSKPFSEHSPPQQEPLPDPLPQPVLAQSLVLPAGPGTFVAHRQSHSTTGTSRPVFAYTVSLDGLPDQGQLPPGEYWIQWSFEGATSPTATVSTPPVSPRTGAFDLNARLFTAYESGAPWAWFEGREGYVAGVLEGRAYALPFELHGTVMPGGPACYANCDQSTVPPVLNVADFTCFLQKFAAGDAYANCDESTVTPVLNVADFTCFLQKFAAGCR